MFKKGKETNQQPRTRNVLNFVTSLCPRQSADVMLGLNRRLFLSTKKYTIWWKLGVAVHFPALCKIIHFQRQQELIEHTVAPLCENK